jgi:hypothetical protein
VLWLPTREGAEQELKLTISLDVEGGGWLVEMTTPGLGASDTPVYSRIVIPMWAIEQDRTDEYVDALFRMHLRFLGVQVT